MPPKKSSPTKAKRGRPLSKSRSRSRSRSTTKKSAPRPRSQSASRKKPVQPKTASPAVAPRSPVRPRSPARTRTPPRVPAPVAVETTPTRMSKRIMEKTTYQDFVEGPPPINPSLAELVNSDDANNNALTQSGPRSVAKAEVVQSKPIIKEAATAATGPGNIAGLLVIFMIGLAYLLNRACSKAQCTLFKLPKFPTTMKSYFNVEVLGFLVVYCVVIFLLAMLPVGSIVQGQPLRDGRRLNYRCNGWLTLLLAAAVFGYNVQAKLIPLDYVNKHYLHFMTADVILTVSLSLVTHVCFRNAPANQRSPSADGSLLNDFWVGRALNPRCGGVDLKQVMFRAATIACLAIDWMYLLSRFRTAQTVEPALGLVVFCHTVYSMLIFRNERTWFSSNDFMTQGFGFMFIWAMKCFMPYAFTLQTRFLYLYPGEGMSCTWGLVLVFLLNVAGLVLMIGANTQKDEFRKNPYNPELSHLSSIPTATGKRLLCSGWWGIVRRPNYLGDLMTAVAWSSLCGCNYGLPHFYAFYLAILLIARVIDDEKSCHKRYGDAWLKYTEVVRYRLIPYVF